MNGLFGANLKYDLKASLVVFLVALPLCLGIAVASGAPPMAGLIAGILGGIVVGAISGSHVAVSGPAAGLTVIVLDSISSLGSFEIFLGAVAVAGVIQLILGFAKAGVIGYYFPHSVIKGMLTAIGLILILKQIPHALGYDKDHIGDMAFEQLDQQNTFTEIYYAFIYHSPGAIPIVLVGLAILILFEKPKIKGHKIFGVIPGPLWAVVAGILINDSYSFWKPDWKLGGDHLVSIPQLSNLSELPSLLTFPDFSLMGDANFWLVAFTVAIIASIETLLSIEAGDKLDPYKRVTPASRELIAQGSGNLVSGLIGGLPLTAVIVRTTANVSSGSRTKMSAIFHGILLMGLVLAIPSLLNRIPLSCLAAVLFLVGYKLANPTLFVKEYKKGFDQFLPFLITIVAILFTDLLVGIGIGMVVGIFFVIKTNFHRSLMVTELNGNYLVKLQKDVSFLNKAPLMKQLSTIPDGSFVIINTTRARFIDHDIQEVLRDFIETGPSKDIRVTLEGFTTKHHQTA